MLKSTVNSALRIIQTVCLFWIIRSNFGNKTSKETTQGKCFSPLKLTCSHTPLSFQIPVRWLSPIPMNLQRERWRLSGKRMNVNFKEEPTQILPITKYAPLFPAIIQEKIGSIKNDQSRESGLLQVNKFSDCLLVFRVALDYWRSYLVLCFQHIFDGGVYKLEGVGSSAGKMVVTVHTPGKRSIVARGNKRGKTVQIRQKGDLWIVLNL